jgi:hypothetical protein
VDNGRSEDAVLTLVRGKTKGTSFYIRKGRKATINGVPDGTYRLYFTGGTDWDRSRRTFTRNCAFKRFEKTVRFSTTRTATSIRYSVWNVTLNAIIGGNARTNDVDPDDFPT